MWVRVKVKRVLLSFGRVISDESGGRLEGAFNDGSRRKTLVAKECGIGKALALRVPTIFFFSDLVNRKGMATVKMRLCAQK
mmetsp:Transcript_5327/g.11785  ORF Transcript_5327/g.11785 Transcript_5327/m.11785 type:complete len:81 (+) Transcript_5327:1669-1911(+)